MKSYFVFMFIILALSVEFKDVKNEFSISVIKDGLKLILYSKGKNKNNYIYDECLNFVEEMKKYRNNIDEYKNNIKSYCENYFGNPEQSTRLQNICQYIIDVIVDDIKNDLLPDYINNDLCNLFN